MTQKEKAKELFDKYIVLASDITIKKRDRTAKKCALIAVDEIIELLYSLKFGNSLSEEIEYYEQVKHELNKSE